MYGSCDPSSSSSSLAGRWAPGDGVGHLQHLSWEDSIMMDDCEDNILTIQDTRPTIHVSRTYHLLWRDISLSLFLPQFLEDDGIDIWHLTHVDLSHNTLPSIPPRFFQLPLLESLDLSHNRLTHLPPVEVWLQESSLQFLKVSHNLLGSDERGGVPGRRGICPALWHLDLRNNQFQHFPYFVLNFLSLRHLDLSNNGMVSKIQGLLCLWLCPPLPPSLPPRLHKFPLNSARWSNSSLCFWKTCL